MVLKNYNTFILSNISARRSSPQSRLTPEPMDKDEGISLDENVNELKLLLELNEQVRVLEKR